MKNKIKEILANNIHTCKDGKTTNCIHDQIMIVLEPVITKAEKWDRAMKLIQSTAWWKLSPDRKNDNLE